MSATSLRGPASGERASEVCFRLNRVGPDRVVKKGEKHTYDRRVDSEHRRSHRTPTAQIVPEWQRTDDQQEQRNGAELGGESEERPGHRLCLQASSQLIGAYTAAGVVPADEMMCRTLSTSTANWTVDRQLRSVCDTILATLR